MSVHTVKCEADYDAALCRINELMNAVPGSPEAEEQELLSILVEDYEDKHYPIEMPSPASAIRFRMEHAGLTETDLLPIFGSAQTLGEILEGKRELTLTMIRRLHAELNIPAEVLIGLPETARPAA